MNIQFKNSDGILKGRLQQRIEEKLAKLSVLTDTPTQSANAFFELERAVGSHQSGDVWQAIINIDSDGERFHTSELAETPEKAADIAIREITIEVKKVRGKKRTLLRRGGNLIKSMQQRITRTGP